MSNATPIFHRPGTKGWLVLSNSLPRLGERSPMLMERMLKVVDLSYPPLCLTLGSTATEEMDSFLDDYGTLTGVEVTTIDLWDVSYEDAITTVSQAGFVILVGGLVLDWIERIDPERNGDSAERFVQQGRLLMAVGTAAAALGSWIFTPPDGEFGLGLAWMPGAVVLPGEAAPMENLMIRNWLAEQEHTYAIGLPHESIIALGPEGEVEVWGETKPVIALGKGWGTE